MKTERFSSNLLNNFLKDTIVATLDELKEALGTNVNKTAIRKLNELPYMQGNSHGGSYYSLTEFAQFEKGVKISDEQMELYHSAIIES